MIEIFCTLLNQEYFPEVTDGEFAGGDYWIGFRGTGAS
jgi:hypothetical protein